MRISPTGNKFRAGFTVIEILVVVALIAVMAGMVVVNVGGSVGKAKVNSIATQMQSLMKYAKVYAKTHGQTSRIVFDKKAGRVFMETEVPLSGSNDFEFKPIVVGMAKSIVLPEEISLRVDKYLATKPDAEEASDFCVYFYPDGQADMTRFMLVCNQWGYSFAVHPVNGMVEMSEGLGEQFKNLHVDLDEE